MKALLRLAFLLFAAHAQQPPPFPTSTFTYLDYGATVSALYDLQRQAPDLVEVWDAQTEYGVASPGTCGGGQACKQVYARITDEASLTPDR